MILLAYDGSPEPGPHSITRHACSLAPRSPSSPSGSPFPVLLAGQ